MTAVAAPQLKQRADACRVKVPVAASTVLYENTMSFINSGGFADDDTASGVNQFGGMVVKQVDNSSGANGDVSCELEREGSWVFLGSGFSQASVGLPLYALDNWNTTLTALAGAHIGKIVAYIDSTHVRCDIEAAASGTATASAYTQTYSTAAKTVPTATQLTPPAGGTGATAGAYDTAVNRDLMIASITAGAADLLALKKVVNALIDDLQAAGVVG